MYFHTILKTLHCSWVRFDYSRGLVLGLGLVASLLTYVAISIRDSPLTGGRIFNLHAALFVSRGEHNHYPAIRGPCDHLIVRSDDCCAISPFRYQLDDNASRVGEGFDYGAISEMLDLNRGAVVFLDCFGFSFLFGYTSVVKH